MRNYRKEMIIFLVKKMMYVVSYFIPLNILRNLYEKTGNLNIARLLQIKMFVLLKKNKVENYLNYDEYIIFNEDKNEFSAFNMCYMCDVWGKALFSLSVGCVPIFKIKDFDGENYFDVFFEKKFNNLKVEKFKSEKYAYSKKYMTGPSWNMTKLELNAYKKINEFFFKIKNNVKNEFEKEYKIIRDKYPYNEIIGVVARGTDYLILKPKGHPIQPDLEQLMSIVETIVKGNYIYLATDEKKILKEFQCRFGNDRIITSESEYYDAVYQMKEANVSRLNFKRENDKYKKGYDYFKRVYILSKLDGLVSGMSGAVRAALIFNKEDYKVKKIIYKGLYK